MHSKSGLRRHDTEYQAKLGVFECEHVEKTDRHAIKLNVP